MRGQLFDEHLLATAAVFRTDTDNVRVTIPGVTTAIATSGKVRAKGSSSAWPDASRPAGKSRTASPFSIPRPELDDTDRHIFPRFYC